MAAETEQLRGPDLRQGVPLAQLPDGEPLEAHADGEPVLLVRRGEQVLAVGAMCTHYGARLAEGVVAGETVRCPWHHACFSLRTGAVLAAPAASPLAHWPTRVENGIVTVGERHQDDPLTPMGDGGRQPASDEAAPPPALTSLPRRVVIVGAGAAGSAAAEALRRAGYAGAVVLVDPDPDAPYDRPNLSKDYLAGNATEEWIPLRPAGFYAEHGIERVVARAVSLDTAARRLALSDGGSLEYDALILATGAEPLRPPIPGADLPQVHVLRSLEDCRGLIRALEGARRAVIAGASFIGMEAAAALRARGVEVTVVAPDDVPFARTLGGELGGMLRALHEDHGVRFQLGRALREIRAEEVVLDDGSALEADVVLLGVGVRPAVELAREAGMAIDAGVLVDSYLRTSAPNVFAAGDSARFPDPRTGERIRVEHWVVAQRQGATAARNALGRHEPFDAVPFFWTQQYDVSVRYVGHAPAESARELDGDPATRDCRVTYRKDGRMVAVATVGRDREALRAEIELERAHG